MHLSNSARPYGDQRGGDRLGNVEIAAVGDPHLAAPRLSRGRTGCKGEGERLRRKALRSLHRRLVRGEGARLLALEDVKLIERDLRKRISRNPEIRGQYVRRRMRKPVRDQQGVVFGRFAIVETKEELAPIRPQSLQRMRQAGREIPNIALFLRRRRRPGPFRREW